MTDLTLKAGSSRFYSVITVDLSGVPIPMIDVSAIVWLILQGTTIIKKKTLAAGDLAIISETGYGADNVIVPQVLIRLPSADTDPATGIGSTTQKKMYQHELWLYFSDGTQDSPESFAGRITITPSVGSGVMS